LLAQHAHGRLWQRAISNSQREHAKEGPNDGKRNFEQEQNEYFVTDAPSL